METTEKIRKPSKELVKIAKSVKRECEPESGAPYYDFGATRKQLTKLAEYVLKQEKK